MRVYLVVIDETQEAHSALRFAARRAADTAGAVHLLALVPKQDFSAFGAVQATIEEEAHDRAEVLAKGFDKKLNSFVQYYGSKQLDASCLRIVLVGFLPPEDPRIRGSKT